MLVYLSKLMYPYRNIEKLRSQTCYMIRLMDTDERLCPKYLVTLLLLLKQMLYYSNMGNFTKLLTWYYLQHRRQCRQRNQLFAWSSRFQNQNISILLEGPHSIIKLLLFPLLKSLLYFKATFFCYFVFIIVQTRTPLETNHMSSNLIYSCPDGTIPAVDEICT